MGHHQSQFLAPSLSLYTYGRLFPRGPGLPEVARRLLIAQSRSCLSPLRAVLPPAGGTASQLCMCPSPTVGSLPNILSLWCPECLYPQFCSGVGVGGGEQGRCISLPHKLPLKPPPSSGACAVHPAEGILKTPTTRPASKALVMPPKAPSLMSLPVPGVTTPALPQPGPSATAADSPACCCLPEALGPFLLDHSRGRPAQGPRVLALLAALGAPTAISAEQTPAGQSPSHFSRPRLSCGVLPGSGPPRRHCSLLPPNPNLPPTHLTCALCLTSAHRPFTPQPRTRRPGRASSHPEPA